MNYFLAEICALLSPTELSVEKPRPVAHSAAGWRGYLPLIKIILVSLKKKYIYIYIYIYIVVKIT